MPPLFYDSFFWCFFYPHVHFMIPTSFDTSFILASLIKCLLHITPSLYDASAHDYFIMMPPLSDASMVWCIHGWCRHGTMPPCYDDYASFVWCLLHVMPHEKIEGAWNSHLPLINMIIIAPRNKLCKKKLVTRILSHFEWEGAESW